MNLKALQTAVSCLFFCAACVLIGTPALAEMVSIKGDNVNMRSGPGTDREVLWRIGNGFPLRVMKRSGEWIQVKDFEGSVGWVRRDMVSNQAHAVVKANKGTDNNINIRKAPSTKSDAVATATYGVVFRVLSRKGDWVQVQHANGVKGWIREDLLWGL